jgi:hypothetical protein
MEDLDILSRIQKLVDEEDGADDERRREIERSLDQCWDLLRQRRARRSAGEDPDDAEPRSKDTVERYLQ